MKNSNSVALKGGVKIRFSGASYKIKSRSAILGVQD